MHLMATAIYIVVSPEFYRDTRISIPTGRDQRSNQGTEQINRGAFMKP